MAESGHPDTTAKYRPGPSGRFFDDRHTIGKERGVAAELVDQEPLDQGPVRAVQDRVRTNEAGDNAAAIDVANHHHGHIGGHGKSHIGDITGAKIDLRRTTRPLDNDEIGVAANDLEALQHARQEFGLVAAIFTRAHAAKTLSLTMICEPVSVSGFNRTGFM